MILSVKVPPGAKRHISPDEGRIINAQPKKRAAICAWEVCGGIEAKVTALTMRLCFCPDGEKPYYFVTDTILCGYRVNYALKNTSCTVSIWRYEKIFVSLCNVQWSLQPLLIAK